MNDEEDRKIYKSWGYILSTGIVKHKMFTSYRQLDLDSFAPFNTPFLILPNGIVNNEEWIKNVMKKLKNVIDLYEKDKVYYW